MPNYTTFWHQYLRRTLILQVSRRFLFVPQAMALVTYEATIVGAIFSNQHPEYGKPVIQYWFFYPFNNFTNDHEGDWEHVNIVLTSQNPKDAKIEKTVYYFHEKYMVKTMPQCDYPTNFDHYVIDQTHPVIFVGGGGEIDNTWGSGSGGGSHGSYSIYSYPNIWSKINYIPAADIVFSERILSQDDANRTINYDKFQIKILKERDDYNYDITPDMSWFNSPIQFGHPRVASYASGLVGNPIIDISLWVYNLFTSGDDVEFDNVGNIAPIGPAFQATWNKTEGGGKFTLYTETQPYNPESAANWQPPADWINKWGLQTSGSNPNATVSCDTVGFAGGAQLKLQVNNTASPGAWVQGPVLNKDIIDIPVTPDLRVNWLQYDKDHALLFKLLVTGNDGTSRWLTYGAKASNHWDTDPGFVNMNVHAKNPDGSREGAYNTWEKYSRNIVEDYMAEYGVAASLVKELRIEHYSYTGWAIGDHGGTIKNIIFTEQPLAAFNSSFESGDYVPYSDFAAYSNLSTAISAATKGTTGSVNPQTGVVMYEVLGADNDNTGANAFCFWNLYKLPITVSNNSYLSFWRNLAESPNGQGRIFIDGTTTEGQTFRDISINGTYLCDQYGNRARPDVARADAAGQWKQYIINLSSLAGKTIANLLVGYDDGPNENGAFKAYFDDVEILDKYPSANQWYAEVFGGNANTAISFDTTHMYGGAQLVLQVNNTATAGLWVQGPALRKDIDDIPITADTRINWLQYDKDHSLLFELLVSDINGKENWLIYGANASNHWDTDPGYVNMAVGQVIPGSSIGERVGRYNVWEKYSRNIAEDYLTEFNEVAAFVKELRIGHYSYTGTDLWAAGDHGGTIKSIVFSDAPRLAFTSGFETTDYTSFADTTYENTIVPAFGGAVGTDNGVVPHSGSKMYKIQGTDVNIPIDEPDAAKAVVPAIDGKTYWDIYDPFVKVGGSTYLSFWMYVYKSPTNFGQIFIDATTKSGKRFSQTLTPSNIYLCDTSGVRITPSIHKAPKGKWVNYVVNLSNAASYPTGLENEIINRLMLGYDDATNDQKGEFIAYIDDVQLLPHAPVYDCWLVAHYGGDANATIGWQEQTGGGAKLVMDNNGGLPVDYVMGPWVIKELSEPIAVSSDRVINWSQYDPIHALSFAAKITGTDGKARWLCYSANGQNHAGEISNEGLFGFVNMGITQETYNQWQTFKRNVYGDYFTLFGVEPSEINALGLSHFSYASWDGDNGGAVRDISFGREGQNWQTIATLLNPLATAYNNANRLAVSALGTLHLALSGIDEILYTYTADQGRNWAAKQTVGRGQHPAIAASSTGQPAAAWIQQWGPTNPGMVLFSVQTIAGWSIPETLALINIGPYDYMGGYSPPSMTIKNDVVSIVYEYAYQIGIPPLVGRYWRLNQVRFPLSDPQNRMETVIDSTSWRPTPTDPWSNPTSATLATDIKGNDHIAWHRDNKVFYRTRKPDGNYGNIVQLSGPGIAQNPCISISGVASVVWEENGDIYMRQGMDQSWDPIVNISQTSAYSAMPTVLNNEIVWSEYITDYNADIFQSQFDINKMAYSYPNNLSQTEYLSTYNHLATYKTLKYTKYYRIWTEEMTPYAAAAKAVKTYYDILFSIDSVSNIARPLYALDAGQVNPSIFTLQRDGYIQYAGETKSGGSISPYKTVDYDSTALIYQFDNIDTTKIIDIVLSFYHELDGELKLKPKVDDIPLGEVKVPSKQEIVLEKRLPAACYRDGMLTLRIEKHKGPIAVCGKILIYENFQGNGHGGAQSEEITSITPNYINKLYQNRPNPFGNKTTFMYQIKNQGQVTFKVYNALGQLVRTLVNEAKPAGAYQVEWDGKDGGGLKVSSGVYIYRLSATGGSALGGQTGDFRDTKKMVIIK